MKPLTVLFLSTGDAARGVMAEALLRHRGGCRFVARSAGMQPEAGVHDVVLTLLKEMGVDTAMLHTKSCQEIQKAARLCPVDVIVTLSEEARALCPRPWSGGGAVADPVRVHWPVDNPLLDSTPEGIEWKVRKCIATLDNRITAFVKSRVAQSPTELMLQLKDAALVVA